MTQDELKRDYISIMIISVDIVENGYAYSQAAEKNNIIECFRQLKNAFIPYSLLEGSLKCFSKYTIGNTDLSDKMRDLRKRLHFMNHLRNKCSGHLDNEVLDKAIQWEPTLFNNESMFSNAYIFLIYKALLESAINSYCDENGVQKYFLTEIDLCYPPNWELFLNFMAESQVTSIDFLNEIKKVIASQIKPIDTREDLFTQAIIASKTDFRLQKRRR